WFTSLQRTTDDWLFCSQKLVESPSDCRKIERKGCHADVIRHRESSFAVEEENRRQTHARRKLSEGCSIWIAQDRKRELQLLRVIFQAGVRNLIFALDANPEKRDGLVPVLFLQLFERLQLFLTRLAPRRPERNQDDLPAHARNIVSLPISSSKTDRSISR